jgi:hypothetical protein
MFSGSELDFCLSVLLFQKTHQMKTFLKIKIFALHYRGDIRNNFGKNRTVMIVAIFKYITPNFAQLVFKLCSASIIKHVKFSGKTYFLLIFLFNVLIQLYIFC